MNVLRVRSWLTAAALLMVGLATMAAQASGAEQVIFGATYTRVAGPPNIFVASFDVVPSTLIAPFRLHVQNGAPDGTCRISSATIDVDQVRVASQSDFNQQVAGFDRVVSLRASNPHTLEVRLTSKPCGFLILTFFGTVPPPKLTRLDPATLRVTAGAIGTLTATIDPVQTTQTTLALGTDKPTVATVPPTATVPPNTASVEIPVTGVAPMTAHITATLNASTLQSTVTVVSAGPTVTGLGPDNLHLSQGASGILTVTISAAQKTDTEVALTSSDPGKASVPSTVIVPAGRLTEPFAVFGVTPGLATITITAELNGSKGEAHVFVEVPIPMVVTLRPPVLPLTEGSGGTFTVILNATQPTDTDVDLTTSDPAVVGLPKNKVMVSAGTLLATFDVTGLKGGLATVTAARPGSAATAAIEVQPPPPAVKDLTCPATLAVRATGLCTVTLNATPLTSTAVPLAADPSGVVTIPPSATVPQDTLSSQFGVTAGAAPGSATITAGPLNGTHQTADVQVVPPPPTIVSLLPASATIFVGATATLTLTLNAAQLTDTPVSLASSAPANASAPATAIVPAGSLSTSVTVTGLSPGPATVTAGPLNATSAQSTITVNQLPPTVTALTPALSLPKGRAGTLTVTIAPTQPDPTVVPLLSSDPNTVGVPPTVTVPAGASTAAFPVLANQIASATITAGPLNATSQTATVTVTPPELVSLAVTPATASIPKGNMQPFTATGTFTDASTQDLTGSATWTSSDATVATITSPGGVATGGGQGRATITASVGSISATATLTVTPPVLVSLAVTPTNPTRDVGQTLQFQATGTLTDGTTQDLTGAVSWTSSDTTIATITSPGGLATAKTTGATIITATHAASGLTASTTLTVTQPATIVSLLPATASILPGETATLTVTLSAAPPADTPVPFAIAPAGVAVGPATFSVPAGQLSASLAVTGVLPGAVTVTAGPLNGTQAQSAIAVIQPPPNLVLLSPPAITLPKGKTATLTLTIAPIQPTATVVPLSSSDPGVEVPSSVTVPAGARAADFSAIARNVTSPAATVTAGPLNATSRQATVTVTAPELATLAVAPAAPRIGTGQGQAFTATGAFTDGTVQDLTASVTWASGDMAVATINASGLATGVGTGSATIQATRGALAAQAALRVEAPLLVSLAVSPATATIAVHTTEAFTATGTFNDGSTADVTAAVRWFSDATFVATVNAAGVATGQGGGQATIAAALGGKSASATLTVTVPPPLSIRIEAPARGSEVRGIVEIRVSAGPDGDIAAVQLLSPGGLSDQDKAPNRLRALWNTTAVPDGPFTIVARATGTAGQRVETRQVVFVANTDVDVGTFSVSPFGLVAHRAQHTATVLRDGRVLIAGGVDLVEGVPLDTAELFEPVPSAPRLLDARMLQARGEHTATLLPSGLVLIAGGTTPDGVTASLEVFDPAAEAFRPLAASLRRPRSGHTATLLLDGRILFSGGEDEFGAILSSLELFDPVSGTSQELPVILVVPRRDHTATLLPDGTILFAGGTADGFNPLASAERLRPMGEPLFPVPPNLQANLQVARFAHTATLLPDGKVLLVGGLGQVGALLDGVEVFNPGTGSFRRAAARLPDPVWEHAAFLAPTGQLFLAGGFFDTLDGTTTIALQAAAPDAQAPAVRETRPAQGATDVPTNSLIGLRLSEPLDVRTLTPATLALLNVGTNQGVAGTVGAGESGLTLFFTSEQPLAAGTTYELRAGSGLADTAGNPLPPFTLRFTTFQPAALPSLAVRPAAPTLQTGGSLQLTALGVFPDGTTRDLTADVAWSSLALAVASVTSAGLVTAVAAGTATIQALSSSVAGSATITVTTTPVPTLVSLAVAPAAATVLVGDAQAFTATGTFKDGTTQDLTPAVAWISQPDVATVSLGGVAAGVFPGLATIRAQFGSISATATLAVLDTTPLALTGYRPDRALAGQAFSLRGVGFSARASDNQVTFAGAGGVRLPATQTAASPTEVTVTVPAGAQTGLVTVEVAGQSASLLLPAGPAPDPVTTAVGQQHRDLAIEPGLGLAVLTNWDGSVTLFDLTAQQAVATLPLVSFGPDLFGVTINPATHVAVVLTRNGLILVDLVQRQVAGTIAPTFDVAPPGTFPKSIVSPGAFLGGAVDAARNQAVLSGSDDHLWIVDLAAGTTLKRIPVGGSGPLALDASRGVAVLLRQRAVDPATGFAESRRDPRAVFVDLVAGRVREEVPLPAPGQALVLDMGSQRAVVSHGSFLTVLDLAARGVLGSVPLRGAGPVALDGAANLVATLNQDRGQGVNDLVFLDLRTGGELGRVPLGALVPFGLAMDPGGRRALGFGDVGFLPPSSTLAVSTYGAFVPGPRLDAVTPEFAAPGDAVTLRGDSLAGAAVTVAAPDGGRLVATVTAQGPSALGILVPPGSAAGQPAGPVAGPVQVVTAVGMTPGPLPLVVPAPQLSVAITSPLPGETRDASPIAVQGTVTPVSLTTSLSVNGVPAVVQGTRWAAANVPVTGGQILVLFATDAADPNLFGDFVTINGGADTPGPLALTAAPAAGPAPLTTTLGVTTSLPPPGPAAPYTLGLAGTGADVAVTALPPPAVAYLRPGLYTPTLTAPTGTGGTASAQAVVRANAPAPPGTPVALSLTPESPVLGKGEALFLDAIGLFADGSTRKVTTLATWTVGDATLASVSGAGTLQGLAPGATTLTATLAGIAIATPVTITPPQLDAITVTPAAKTILRGETAAFTATGLFSDGTTEDLTTQVTWSSGDATIATVDATGLAQAVGVGNTTIRAALGSITGTATLTVAPPVLQRIAVTPTLPVLTVGQTLQLGVTGTLSDGTTQDLTAQATWTSNTPSIATLSSTGLGTAVAQGATFIRATVGSFFNDAILTVLPASSLQALAVSVPATAGLGGFGFRFSAGGTIQFAATGTFADGSSQDLTLAVTWTSSDPTIATIAPGGRAQAFKAGSTTITATRGAVSGTFGLTVFDEASALDVTPATPTLAVGQTLQLAASTVGSGSARRDLTALVTWTSSNPAAATISATGLVTALAPGTATLVARFGSLGGTTTLTVTPPLIAITIPPGTLSLPLGETLQLQARGTFSDGSSRDLTALVAFASSNPAVAVIGPTGLVTTTGLGLAVLTATRDSIVGTLTLTVTGGPPTITITSPARGATINADHVIVRGTVSSGTPGDIGVTVNGFPALVNNGQWAAEVPLKQGGNILAVMATDSTGARFTTSIDVTVPQATSAPLILQAVPSSGVSPLTVAFTAINQTGRNLVQFEFDPNGSGTFGAPTPTFDGATVTYTGSGLLFPTLRATDDQGQKYTATTLVNLEDPATVTARFQARWNSFKDRLKAGDIPGALAHLAPGIRAKFQTVFQRFGAGLPAIAAGLGDVEVLGQVEDLAETAIIQQEKGVPHMYFVYFRRDNFGQWLIEEM